MHQRTGAKTIYMVDEGKIKELKQKIDEYLDTNPKIEECIIFFENVAFDLENFYDSNPDDEIPY